MKKNVGRITMNPKIMTGKPIVCGTRIPVELIVRLVSQGVPNKAIIKEYPSLEIEDIQACLAYAAAILSSENVYPLRLSA